MNKDYSLISQLVDEIQQSAKASQNSPVSANVRIVKRNDIALVDASKDLSQLVDDVYQNKNEVEQHISFDNNINPYSNVVKPVVETKEDIVVIKQEDPEYTSVMDPVALSQKQLVDDVVNQKEVVVNQTTANDDVIIEEEPQQLNQPVEEDLIEDETDEDIDVEDIDDEIEEIEEEKVKKSLFKKKAKKEKQPKAPKEKKEKKRKLTWYTKLLLLVDLCAAMCFFTAYGPLHQFRDWLVTTAMSTATHRYFAYTLYSYDYVKEICASFVAVQTEENTDTSAITFKENTNEDGVYSSIYEEQILKKNNPDDLYKIVQVSEDGFSGFITVLYEPTRLNLVVASGKNGLMVSDTVTENKAMIGINAGPAEWHGSTLIPYNNVIANGKIVNNDNKKAEIIGMNEEGVLVLLKTTAKKAMEQNLVWGVSFGPNLIVNGVKTKFTGNGGYGVHPRTAIGQRQDGIILLFTIDGRGGGGSKGIDMVALRDLCARYGCYNAANLDGGGSSVLVEKGVVINHPVSYQYARERKVYNCLIYK